MTPPIRFDELLEAVESLPDETQAELVDVIRCPVVWPQMET